MHGPILRIWTGPLVWYTESVSETLLLIMEGHLLLLFFNQGASNRVTLSMGLYQGYFFSKGVRIPKKIADNQ